jgi:hypothetical protein
VTPRRFPPPWTVEESQACFIVKDHAGHSLAYVYSRMSPDPPLGFMAEPPTRNPKNALRLLAIASSFYKRISTSHDVRA